MMEQLLDLLNEIKGELTLIRAEQLLANHDLTQIREQLDRLEINIDQQPRESIGIAPNTPDWIPPESAHL